eukprot:m.107373 g.107373  ORF g.107373 m.107373 type:complete len:524 (-) comp27789_c1_seq2:203-1774(-)
MSIQPLPPSTSSLQARVLIVVGVVGVVLMGLMCSDTFVNLLRYDRDTPFRGKQDNTKYILRTRNRTNSYTRLEGDHDVSNAFELLAPLHSSHTSSLPLLRSPTWSSNATIVSGRPLSLINDHGQQMSTSTTTLDKMQSTTVVTPVSTTVCTNPTDFMYHGCDTEIGSPSLHNGRIFVAKVDASQGFGCQILFLIQVAAFAHSLGLTPFIALTSSRAYRSQNTSHSHNILLYSFVHCGFQRLEDVRVAQQRLACNDKTVVAMRADRWMRARLAMIKTATSSGLQQPQRKRFPLRGSTTRNHANEIFSRFLHVHPSVEEAARAFWLSQFQNDSCVVGVHYRGKDKVEGEWAESKRFSVATMATMVYNVLRVEGCSQVLIASDEPRFFTQFSNHLREQARLKDNTDSDDTLLIVAAPLKHACMSNCSSLHYDVNVDNFSQIREATGTMLLLSWCKHLVKTPSLFSAVSAIMNPDLHVSLTHYPQKYFQFPEHQMQLTSEFLAASSKEQTSSADQTSPKDQTLSLTT